MKLGHTGKLAHEHFRTRYSDLLSVLPLEILPCVRASPLSPAPPTDFSAIYVLSSVLRCSLCSSSCILIFLFSSCSPVVPSLRPSVPPSLRPSVPCISSIYLSTPAFLFSRYLPLSCRPSVHSPFPRSCSRRSPSVLTSSIQSIPQSLPTSITATRPSCSSAQFLRFCSFFHSSNFLFTPSYGYPSSALQRPVFFTEPLTLQASAPSGLRGGVTWDGAADLVSSIAAKNPTQISVLSISILDNTGLVLVIAL